MKWRRALITEMKGAEVKKRGFWRVRDGGNRAGFFSLERERERDTERGKGERVLEDGTEGIDEGGFERGNRGPSQDRGETEAGRKTRGEKMGAGFGCSQVSASLRAASSVNSSSRLVGSLG
jgi:hypothetical protein